MHHIIRLISGTSPKTDEESAPLLNDDSQSIADTSSAPGPDSMSVYGSISVGDTVIAKDSIHGEDEEKKPSGDKASKKVGRIAYVRRFSIFIPYIWPSKNRQLQANMIGIFVCLAAIRVLKLLAPYQLGIVVNLLGNPSGHFPIREMLLYFLFNWVDSSGLIELVKAYMWIPIDQHAERSLLMAAYCRVMILSSDFHDNKKSGELYKSIEQGTSIHKIFEQVIFELSPMICDLVVACVYLSYLFGWYMSFVVCTVFVAYVWTARAYTKKQAPILTRHAEATRAENQVLYDTVGSWISVAYFNNFGHEENRYLEAITKLFNTTRELNFIFYIGNLCKESVMEIGYSGACLLAAYQVFKGNLGVGAFVVLLNYWARFTGIYFHLVVEFWLTLTGPLNYFGYLQRSVQQNFVEAEQLLELLETEPTVKNGAADFQLHEGAIDFKGVHFSYDGTKPIIENLTFSAFPGQKVALVGETGCGKSTILKLLFRLYDVGSGSITIDGQDVRDVTLESLRSCIGVVPQDPVLFNDTVMNNVRYSRLDATDEQVLEACRAAAIHDKIRSFTDGYASIVGENGVKLSGGEIQRIAIARAILMDPKIILLDEATSAIDSHTEAQIQTALRRLIHGRTAFCVAHRLSTVMDADVMLVIQNGRIAEQGSPKELLKLRGEFFNLWSLQNIATE